MNCSPSSLANAARCFKSCIPQGDVQAVKSYLLCQIAKVGLGSMMSPNIVPPGSMYPATGIPVFNLTVLANSTYQITWGANDQSMTMGSETYVSGGSGTVIIVYTNGNTNMAFIGTNNGTTVTVVVQVAPKAVPIPGDFTLLANAGYTNVIASWDTPPANVTKTEVWTSTDGINYSLAQTIAAPGNSATLAMPAVGSTIYCKIRWFIVTQGAFTAALSFLNTTWATQFNTNSGLNPSANETASVNNFYNGVVNAGLLSNVLCCNCLVGAGNAVGMGTPIIKGSGTNPWTAAGVANGYCTVNGFNSNGSFYESGFLDNSLSLNNAALWCYDVTGGADTANHFLYGTFNGADAFCGLRSDPGTGTNVNIGCWSIAGSTTITTTRPAGLYIMERIAATDLRLWFFNSTNPLAQLGATIATAEGAQSGIQFYIGALNNAGGGFGSTTHTISFWAATISMTTAQKAAFAKLIQALRVAIGGGFV